MLTYLIEVQLCIALFWVVYRLFLHRSGALNHNRGYLLGAMVRSLVIPALSIPLWPAQQVAVVMWGDWEGLTPAADTAAAVRPVWDWKAFAGWGYAAGVAVMLGIAVRQSVRLAALARRARIARLDEARIVYSERIDAPCSFFNYVFLNANEEPDQLPQVLAHELAHIRLKHSADSVFAQIVLIVLWWNPFVWLWCRSLKEIHEFQADRAVLQRGFDSEQYIRLLIETVAGIHPEFVSGFSYSLIKKRLLMISRSPSARRRTWRFAAAVPVVGITMLLFSFVEKTPQAISPTVNEPPVQEVLSTVPAEPESTAVAPRTSAPQPPPASDDDEPFMIVSDMPRFEGGDLSDFRTWVNGQIQYPPLAKQNGIQGRVTLQFVIEKDGSVNQIKVINSPDLSLSNEAVRVIGLSPKWTPAKNNGELARVSFLLPVDFRLRGNQEESAPSTTIAIRHEEGEQAAPRPLIVLDGEPMPANFNLDIIDQRKIDNITVLRDEDATKVYGDAGKNGVIVVKTKKSTGEFRMINNGSDSIRIIGYGTQHRYGIQRREEGKHSSIQILMEHVTSEAGQPLFIVDGKPATEEDFKQMIPDIIQSIEILKDETATRIYGEAGKNGVVHITLKPTE
jgi:TonB family protein